MKYKKILFVNTITIFLFMFLFSNIYNWFPSFITASIFPVNESLFEHLKLMYITEIIMSSVIYLIFKIKKINFSNYFLGLLGSTIFTIIIFFIIYLPIYNRFGEGLIYTMIIYLIVLILGQIVFYFIMTKIKYKYIYNVISIILILLIWILLIYFTYNPKNSSFFFDPISESYGISTYR